ncbi:Glycosyltransferase family 4 protein [Candidatus Methylobacter favarea]|uniref:Glycosyltransferase family 4 protein n=1 Tax=Candidatus Methylobacter favarea TaxID=2707345 RepID=A0A8S0Y6F9_9GAMM|nr:glycosyltransferase family 4 protein [Candidatus Methylobacter favarea]CAA9891293.1 Glycosyltransferase family 4 protein [Candidatus Methylobacter favarea]
MKPQDKFRMRLLIFISSMAGGGAERVSANLANYWAAKEWDITIVTLAQQRLDFYDLHPAVKRIALDLAGESANALAGLLRNVRRVLALRRVLRQLQPDIALGMMTTADVLLALAAWRLPMLRTVGAERNHPPQMPLGYLWETLRSHTYGLLNAVTALSREGKDWIKTHTNAQQVTVIPNAVTWPLPRQEPRMNPNALCRSERQLLLAVGRLEAQKGFDWLIEAFSTLADKHSDWDLVILGEGSLRTTLEGQVRASGLDQRIFLPGRAGNVGEWYESADLYVMSSRFEGFPNTLVEAMAHGLAAVSFDCDTGPRDIIRQELDGLLVPPGNIAELTTALDRLMSDALTRQHFAERAVEVRERFSMARIAGMWEKLFNGLLLEQK